MVEFDKLAGQRLLVTGGAGFVGARLVRSALNHSTEIHLVVRPTTNLNRIADIAPDLQFHHVDLSHRDALSELLDVVRPDVIVHLAASGAYGKPDQETLFRDNVLATHNLLRATDRRDDLRLIYTASSLEPGPRSLPISEDDPPAPITPFAAAKAASTLLARHEARSARPIVILRPFSVYGPGEPSSRLIPTAIRAGLSDHALPLTAPGYVRDYVYVDDVAEAYLVAAVADDIDGKMFNIASGRASSNEEVVGLVAKHLGKEIAVRPGTFAARPTDTTHWVADVTRAEQHLGWVATHTLDEGIAKTVAWFRDHG